MKRIWKYQVPAQHQFTISMPEAARLLDVQVQNGEPFMWVVVDPDKALVGYHFAVFVTGEELPDDLMFEYSYIGTFLVAGGEFVGHLFQKVG